MNDCDVFWISRITVPALRITRGSCSGPKNRRAAAPRMAMSGIESIRRVSSRSRATRLAPDVAAVGFRRGREISTKAGFRPEDHLHAREPDGDARLDRDASQDSQPVRRAPRLLRNQLAQQARA